MVISDSQTILAKPTVKVIAAIPAVSPRITNTVMPTTREMLGNS